jgi:hypothetical protein
VNEQTNNFPKGKSMKIRQLFALGALLFGVSFLAAPSVHAQSVTCAPVNSSATQWPPGGSVLSCNGSANASYGSLMRSTLETIGNDGSDAAQRLKFVITASETIYIEVVDPSLSGGAITASHITINTDSMYTIAADLADQIAQLPNFVAYASGNVVYIYSFTGNTTTYNMSTSTGAHETITSTPDGLGNATATLAGTPSSFTWYEFGSRYDYDAVSTPIAADKLPPVDLMDPDSAPQADGVTNVRETATQQYSAVFEVNGYAVNNQIVQATTAHELGHVVDHIYGKLFSVPPDENDDVFFSNRTDFQQALTRDKFYMDLVPVCAFQASSGQNRDGNDVRTGGPYASTADDGVSPSDHGGLSGTMTGVEDPSTSGYVCDEDGFGRNAPYEPTMTLINTMFSSLRADKPEAAAEIFAEEYAVQAGFPDQWDNSGNPRHGKDGVFNQSFTGNFVCTNLYVYTLRNYGRTPNSYELSVYGYTVPDGPISGAPVDNGMYGYGATFYGCDGVTQEHADYGWGS